MSIRCNVFRKGQMGKPLETRLFLQYAAVAFANLIRQVHV